MKEETFKNNPRLKEIEGIIEKQIEWSVFCPSYEEDKEINRIINNWKLLDKLKK